LKKGLQMMMKRLLGIAPAAWAIAREAVGLGVVLAALGSTAYAGGPAIVPEIDAGSLLTGLTLLAGGILILTNRSRRK
jgi:hypothetical protein